MKVRVIYLDIDGVLNNHSKLPNGYCGINPKNLAILDELLQHKEIHVVISSSWRYLIHCGSMNLIGFRNMMLTHGMVNVDKIIGYIRPDAYLEEFRADQILEDINKYSIKYYCVIDDGDFGFTERKMNFVKIDGSSGLESWHIPLVLEKLGLK